MIARIKHKKPRKGCEGWFYITRTDKGALGVDLVPGRKERAVRLSRRDVQHVQQYAKHFYILLDTQAGWLELKK